MPRNNSKARKDWRRERANLATATDEELAVLAMFGAFRASDDARPGSPIYPGPYVPPWGDDAPWIDDMVSRDWHDDYEPEDN